MVDFHYADPVRRAPFAINDVCRTTLFDNFTSANTFKGILAAFNQICADLRLDPLDYQNFYTRLKTSLNSWKAEKLWALLDNRAAQKEYRKQRACQNLRVLIIGAGPCGLRLAIECALLGCKVVVLEKRDRFSRNNVLHFWPFVIHDLRALGAKFFYPRFCAGSIDHISIRQLQCVLLKIALVLGVEIHENVAFTELVQPERGQDGRLYGWRANVIPEDHYVSDYEFDVLFGADGKRNTVPGFRRKEFRGKLAIAVTANFINRRAEAEERVPELSGVAFVFNQQFFKDMRQATGIDLENIVYYKDDTHYFVMTAKKQSLLQKGVIKRDADDIGWLLSAENVNQDALLAYAREAADFATEGALPRLDYALNHYGQPDVAMFDFTSLFSAEYSCRFVERIGQRLLIGVVGDSLHEPFWPTGSGCARGFLGAFDAAWMLRQYCGAGGEIAIGDILAERESSYRLLAQTTPENLSKSIQLYTIDPRTRYPRFEATILGAQVRGLVDTDNPAGIDEPLPKLGGIADHTRNTESVSRKRSYGDHGTAGVIGHGNPETSESPYVRHQQLARWYQSVVAPYRVRVDNLTTSFRSGLALLAVLRRYRPDVMPSAGGDEQFYGDLKSSLTSPSKWHDIRSRAFTAVRKEFGLDPPLSINDKEGMYNYLSALKEILIATTPQPLPIPAVPVNESPVRSAEADKDNDYSRRRIRKTPDPPGIYGQETEEQRQERYQRRLQTLKAAEELFGSGSQSNSPLSPTRYTRHRPAHVEKLKGERLKEVEMMLQGKVQETKREVKQKIPAIKMHKLNSREVEEMEQKLRETGMGCLLNHPIEPTLSSKESKVIAVKTKILKERAKDCFKERNMDKYSEFDKNLKDLDKWLHKPNLSGALGVKDLLEQHQQNIEYIVPTPAKKCSSAPPPVPPKKSPTATPGQTAVLTPLTPDADSKQPLCHFCNQRVYLAEKLSVENLSCHRRCFRCAYCDAPLKLNGYGMERIEYDGYGKQFFCTQHLNLNLLEKVSKIKVNKQKQQQQLQLLHRSHSQRETAADFQPSRKPATRNSSRSCADNQKMKSDSESGGEEAVDASQSSFDSLSQSRDLLSSGVFYSNNTPERAEFEVSLRRRPLGDYGSPPAHESNNRSSVKEGDEEEELFDEEEILRHNVGHDEIAANPHCVPLLKIVPKTSAEVNGRLAGDVESGNNYASEQRRSKDEAGERRSTDGSESDELLSDEERALTNLLETTGGALPSLDETVTFIQTLKTKRQSASRENLVDDDQVATYQTVDQELSTDRDAQSPLINATLYFTPDLTRTQSVLCDSVFKTPTSPSRYEDENGASARQRLHFGLEKTRAEARARARLKSDEELCLAMSNRSGARYRSASMREQVLARTKSQETLSPKRDETNSDALGLEKPLKRKTLSEELTATNDTFSSLTAQQTECERGGTPTSALERKKSPSILSRLFGQFNSSPFPASPSSERPVVASESSKETSLLSKVGWKYGPKRRSRGSLSPQQSFDLPQEKAVTVKEITRERSAPKASVEEVELSDLDSDDQQLCKPCPGQHVQSMVHAGKEGDSLAPLAVSRSSDSLLSAGSNVSDRDVRRVQRAAAKIVKQAGNKRHRQAGEVQRQMEELDVKRHRLNEDGSALEKRLQKDPKNRALLERWLLAVEERERLNHYEQQLRMHVRELELENQHHQLQQLFRDRLCSLADGDKSSKQLQQEQQLLQQMLYVVSQRDALLSDLEKLRSQDAETYEPDAIAKKVSDQLQRKHYNFGNFRIVFTGSNLPGGPESGSAVPVGDERRYSSALDSVI